MSVTPSAMCRVPGALAGRLCQGTGPLSAQSTLIVDGSSWKALHPAAHPVRYVGRVEQVVVQVGRRDRRHDGTLGVDESPSAVCTVRARPCEVPMRSTGLEQRISPPE